MKVDRRIKNLRQKLTEKELDGILISQPENRCYLSGFNGSAGYLLITQAKTILATDFRYIEQSQNQAPDYEIFKIDGKISWLIEISSLGPIKMISCS